jgi:peptide/nickel transport system substrate-binding protein
MTGSRFERMLQLADFARTSRRAVLQAAIAGAAFPAALTGGSRQVFAQATPGAGTTLERVVVALPVDVSTLDPYQMFSKLEGSVADHVIQTLTFRAPDMTVQPLLATEWRRLDGDLTWEFTLREGVTFSNGEPFNAEAAKFSIDHLNQRNAEGKPLGSATVAVPSAEITSVEAVDDTTLRITTATPKALLDLYLAQWPMVAPTFYTESSDDVLAEEMIGTGPYVVAERVRDDRVVLHRNETYWGAEPTVDEIVFRIIPEVSTEIAELQTGGVDIVPGLPIDQAQILLDQEGVRVETIEGGRRVFVGITTNGPEPLQDKRVRQALNMAIDWDSINEGLFLGRTKRMSHVFNPPNDNTDIEPYPYDPEGAKALLAEAGYPDGFELDAFATPVGRWINDLQLAQVVKSQLEAIGVTFKEPLQTFEWGVYREKLLAYDVPALFMQASGGEFEAAGEAADFTIESPSDFYRWDNPEYERLWDELKGELDMDRRHEIALEMQEIIHDDAPIIFLYNQLDTYGVNDRLNWSPRIDELIHLWDVTGSSNS